MKVWQKSCKPWKAGTASSSQSYTCGRARRTPLVGAGRPARPEGTIPRDGAGGGTPGQHSCCQWERWFLKECGQGSCGPESCGKMVREHPACCPSPRSPPAWPFPEAFGTRVLASPRPLPHPSAVLAPQGPANLQGVIVFVLVLQGLGSVSVAQNSLLHQSTSWSYSSWQGEGAFGLLGKGHDGFLCPHPSLSCPGLLLFSRG